MDRRKFIGLTSMTVVGAAAVAGFPNIVSGQAMPFTLPALPYADNALSPVISANTIGFHYGKHHKGYVDTLNKLVKGTAFEKMSLEDVVMKTAKSEKDKTIFNNAAQIWNHNFYWNSMNPKGGGKPSGKLAQAVERDFGSFDAFKKQLADTTVSQFGTGWGWLAADKKGKLSIVKTGDAEVPMTQGLKPLLTIDVWEHAYYLDYQNKRADYVNAVIDKLLNWEFAAKNLG